MKLKLGAGDLVVAMMTGSTGRQRPGRHRGLRSAALRCCCCCLTRVQMQGLQPGRVLLSLTQLRAHAAVPAPALRGAARAMPQLLLLGTACPDPSPRRSPVPAAMRHPHSRRRCLDQEVGRLRGSPLRACPSNTRPR